MSISRGGVSRRSLISGVRGDAGTEDWPVPGPQSAAISIAQDRRFCKLLLRQMFTGGMRRFTNERTAPMLFSKELSGIFHPAVCAVSVPVRAATGSLGDDSEGTITSDFVNFRSAR